jgi:hypothetical protein
MTRLALALLALLLAGCATAPLTGPQTYQDDGMSFSIPAGWKVTMHGKNGDCSYAFIEAPGEAVVFIKGEPLQRDPGLEKYARDFSRTASSSTPVGKISSKGFHRFTDKQYGPALKEPFSITLFGVEVPHTRFYRKRTGSHCAYYLLTQVADEDAAPVEKGFREILGSFSAR